MATQFNPVVWFEIYVQDMARARAFYSETLGVQLEALAAPDSEAGVEMWNFSMTGEAPGAAGALVKMDGVPSGGNSVLVYFGCADCAIEAARAARAGGAIEKPKFSIGQYGHIALVENTEGNLIGLHSME